MADTQGTFDNAFNNTQRTINSGFGTQLFRNTATDTSYSLDPVTDTADFFRLRLSRRSSVVLTLNGITSNANLALLDSSGDALQTSENGGSMADSLISEPLAAGDYYIRVSLADSAVSTNYTLGVNTVSTARADLLWRNTSTGQNVVWLMNGTSLGTTLFSTTVGDQNWKIETTGDMNGDSVTDYIWRNTATGQNVIWIMDGNTLRSSQFLPSVGGNWRIEGAADFDADGKTDLLWRNFTTGQNLVWFMNGFSIRTTTFLPDVGGATWEINAVADFNGDNRPDLVWRNYTTGQNLIWMMNGTTLNSVQQITALNGSAWRIVGAGDFNGDGQQDLAWRNYSSGQNVVWLMNSTSLASVSFLTSITSTSWQASAVISGAPVIDLAGNNLNSAFNVGAVTASGIYSDTIGSPSDFNDYYRFTLSTATTLNLSLGGLSGNADLQLIADLNNNGILEATDIVYTSANTGSNDESIVQALSAVNAQGQPINYYVRVYSAEVQRTPYSLNISGTASQQIDLRLTPTTTTPPSFRLTTTGGGNLPSSVNIGSAQTVRVNYSLQNNSLSVTPAQFRVSFYLSRDQVITPNAAAGGDQLLGSTVITGLAPNATVNNFLDVALPTATNSYWGGDQTYYIGMYIDSDNEVAETAETNNTVAAPINITGTLNPDVVGGGLNITQQTSQPGQAIRVSGTVRNIGNVSTGANQQFFILFHFSNDDIKDEGDWTFTGNAVISTIAARSSTTFDSAITQSTQPNYFNGPLVLPDRTWDGWRGNGRYYVMMEVNYFNVVPETDGGRENNLNYGRQIGSFVDYNFIEINGL